MCIFANRFCIEVYESDVPHYCFVNMTTPTIESPSVASSLKMEECVVANSKQDGLLPSECMASHHVHILVLHGSLFFSDGHEDHRAGEGDLVIWQMSNTISQVSYSEDFECDSLLVAPQFLVHFNPEMVWASRGYVFIRLNPVFHLEGEVMECIKNDFALFRQRQAQVGNPFRRELLGRVLQMFLYDLWWAFRDGVTTMDATDTLSHLFFRYLTLVEQHVVSERTVAYYADRLCITPKYLSQVCRTVSGVSAMRWIEYYVSLELVSRLDDGKRPLGDIADELGFSSLQFFSRYVKKILGLSPTDYRRSKGLL